MAKKMDYKRGSERARMARYGSESISGGDIPAFAYTPRIRPSKSDQRAANEAALAHVTRSIKCPKCGHRANVHVTKVMLAKPHRCSECGTRVMLNLGVRGHG